MFQGNARLLFQVGVDRGTERRTVPAGTVIVPVDQPLGLLAAYLLEPESEDGLVTWEQFGDRVAVGAELPTLRLVTP